MGFLKMWIFDHIIHRWMPNKRGWLGPFFLVLIFGIAAVGWLFWRSARWEKQAVELLEVSWAQELEVSDWDVWLEEGEMDQLAALMAGLEYSGSSAGGSGYGSRMVLTGQGQSREFRLAGPDQLTYQDESVCHVYDGAGDLNDFVSTRLERTLAGIRARELSWADSVTVDELPVNASPEQIRQLTRLISDAKLISVGDTAPAGVGTMMTVSLSGGSESRDFAIYSDNLLQWRDADRRFYLFSIDPAAYALVEDLYRTLMLPAA